MVHASRIPALNRLKQNVGECESNLCYIVRPKNWKRKNAVCDQVIENLDIQASIYSRYDDIRE